MIVRRAEIKDLDQVTNLFDQYRVFYEKSSDLINAKQFLYERISNEDSVIYVAETENKLVGFTQLYPLFSSTRMRRLWLLNDLFVEPSFRGKGVSILLIDKAKELCKNTDACAILLETAKTNDIGNNLYPKAGFSLDKDFNYYEWENI